jgi:glycosyltransferase involved in cell wall biosynthesis
LIIGEGLAKQVVMDMIHKFKLDNNVKLITNIENDKLNKYYLASDIFVLPSYSEGLPKALLEAMACGAPVVVSDISAHKGLIEHGVSGYTFKVGDIDSLTSIILDVLSKPEERKSVASNARKLIEEKFTWQSVTQRLDNIYSNLVKTV